MKKKVVILDLNKKDLKLIEETVSFFDFEIMSTTDVKQALQYYIKNKPDIFIVDPFFTAQNVQGIEILNQFMINNASMDNPVTLIAVSDHINQSTEKILKKITHSYCSKKQIEKLTSILKQLLSQETVEQVQTNTSYKEKLNAEPFECLLEQVEFKNKDKFRLSVNSINKPIEMDSEEKKKFKRQHRTQIIKNFWDFYTEIAKLFASGNLDKKVYYETLCLLRFRAIPRKDWSTPEQIQTFIHNIDATDKCKHFRNIFYADEWLERIYNGKIVPTYNDILVQEFRRIRDMYPMLKGLNTNSEDIYYSSLAKYLGIVHYDNLKKAARKNSETFEPVDDKQIFEKGKELLFDNEIKEMFKALTNTCIGPQGNKMPIFCQKDDFDVLSRITSKAEIVQYMKEIEEIDPLLFRRVRLNREHFVAPYVILVPCLAKNGICWDPWHDSNKSTSPGRIAIPILTEQKLQESVYRAFASLRWRTSKQVADIYWMEEGLTGLYYQYFEDNKRRMDEETGQPYLSSRDSIEECFIQDYIKWIESESQGRLKLRKEVREIFWFHIPLPDKVKTRLKGRGQIYEELLQKDMRRTKSRFTSL